MLWFTMMLMPAGPSAMKVMVLADVADAEHKDKMIIAKFLAVSVASTAPRGLPINISSDHIRHLATDDIDRHRRLAGLQCCYVMWFQIALPLLLISGEFIKTARYIFVHTYS